MYIVELLGWIHNCHTSPPTTLQRWAVAKSLEALEFLEESTAPSHNTRFQRQRLTGDLTLPPLNHNLRGFISSFDADTHESEEREMISPWTILMSDFWNFALATWIMDSTS